MTHAHQTQATARAHAGPRRARRWLSPLALAGALCFALACAYVAPARATTPADAPTSKAAMGALSLANHHYKSGHFKKAASLYHEAYRLEPRGAFLFNAARAEMRAMDHAAAERDFKRYLNLPETSAKGRKRAQTHLDEITAYRADLARKQAAAAKKAAAAARPAVDGLTIGLWVGAATLVVAGSVSYGAAYAMRRSTNDLDITSEADLETYHEQVENQNNIRNVGAMLAGVGVGVGVWAALRTFKTKPAEGAWVAPMFSGHSVGLVGRF